MNSRARDVRSRLAGCTLLLTLYGCPSEPTHEPRPDILLIYVDDLGFGDVGYQGSDIRTPAIDALARTGMILSRFYASPMCTPSRAQLMTGRHAAHFGLHANVNIGEGFGLPETAVTLPELLQAEGYATHLIGKWHLAHREAEHHPLRHGFDHFYGHLGGWIDYMTHEREGRLDWERDGQAVVEQGYATDLLADEAVRVIEQQTGSGEPLFIELAFNAPHTPLHHAPTATKKVPSQTVERTMYRGMVEHLDAAVDRVLSALENSGRRESCMVVFASDNGGSLTYGADNGVLARGKFATQEGGIRVPAIVSWPGRVASGTTSEQVVTNLDLLPTLASAAGVSQDAMPAELDGRDVLGEWCSGASVEREDLYFAIRQRRHIRSALLSGSLKLNREVNPDGEVRETLFDVFADPAESKQLNAERGAELSELRAQLDAFEAAVAPGGL
jgi:arylsulfatase B